MTREEIRFQVAVSCIQGVLEAKLGILGEIAPKVAVRESLRIADEFVRQWFGEQPETELAKEIDNYYQANIDMILSPTDTKVIVSEIASHFYELGLNTKSNHKNNLK